MGKNKNKKNKNQYREEYDDKKMAAMRGEGSGPREQYNKRYNEDTRPDKKNQDRPQQQVEHHPVAILLQNEMIRQITEFLDGPISDETAKSLFNLGSYPARLAGCENAEDYEAYQLDRSVRLNRDDPDKLNRLSTIIVIQNIATHKPAFLVQAFISPNRSARVIVHQQDDKGTIYRNTLRWSKD